MSNERAALAPILLGLAVALGVLTQRVGLERGNDTVALIAEYGDVQALAAYTGGGPAGTLAMLAEAGVTAVAVDEASVADLLRTEQLRATGTDGALLVTGPAGERTRAAIDTLLTQFPAAAHAVSDRRVQLAVPWSVLQSASAGHDPAAAAAIAAAGLAPVVRLRNIDGLTPDTLARRLQAAAALGGRLLIFSGDQVLGFRGLVDATAAQLAASELVWGRIEFARQRGEERLAEELLSGPTPTSYVRVHSITPGEMQKLSAPMVVERYRRAARERNIRALYLRLPLAPDPDLREANVAFVGDVVERLRANGLEPGQPEPWPLWQPGPFARLVIGSIGIAAAAGWLAAMLLGGNGLAWWALIAVPSALVLFVAPGLYVKVMGLLAGIVYPTLGGRWAWLRLAEGRVRGRVGAVGLLWGAVGWSVLGGLLIAALMADTGYMLSHDTFSGVKLTQLVPILLVALMVAWRVGLPDTDAAALRERWTGFWRDPILRWQVAVAFVALALLALLVLRSGNEAAEVPAWELRFRSLLEVVFGARPRTKEFLFGHPLLLLAGLAAWRGRRDWAAALLIPGMVGVVSTVNTFSHLHTPLTQSLLRTFHALWLGSLLGLLIDAAVGRRLWGPAPADAPVTPTAGETGGG